MIQPKPKGKKWPPAHYRRLERRQLERADARYVAELPTTKLTQAEARAILAAQPKREASNG